jgi:hypothetical protein
MKALVLALLAALLAACSSPAPAEDARAELASLVLMHTELGPELDELARFPACGAVAIGAREVVTAAHCVPAVGETVELVTREQWFTTSNAVTRGRVVSRGPGDVATLKPGEPLERFTELSPEAPSEALLVRRFEPVRVRLEGDTLRGVTLHPGESGSGVFDARSRLIAIVSECFLDAAGECDARGGLVVRP